MFIVRDGNNIYQNKSEELGKWQNFQTLHVFV